MAGGEPAGGIQASVVVQRGQVARALEFGGYVVPREETTLYFASSGYVKQVYVKQGDVVQTGDLLAELETGDLHHQIAEAELDLRLAQENVAAATDALRDDVARAELSVQLAQERLAQVGALEVTYTAAVTRTAVAVQRGRDAVGAAEAQYREAQARPDVPQESLNALSRQIRLARWDLQTAEAQYEEAVSREAAYQHDLKIQEIAVQQAQSELAQLTQGRDLPSSLDDDEARQVLEELAQRAEPALARAVDQAQLTLERLRAQLARARIVSPMDGQVLSLPIRPGYTVEPFQAVISIADRSQIEISAELTSGEISELTEGQRAYIGQDGASQRVWEGTVRCLPYPYGSCGRGGDLLEAADSVRISLMGGVDGLNMGDPVGVSIVLEEREDVLWLPPGAIRTVQDRKFVIVQEGRRERRVEVQVGIEGKDRAEIVSGLNEGQLVVVP
jgi:multidrug resistance efflux pump